MPGTHPPNILVGGTSTGISPQYYYVLSDIVDHYWLPYVRSASSRFHSVIRRHQCASVRQADSRLTRLVPPNLELALTPLVSVCWQLAGASYLDIHRAGGGIHYTVRHVQAASEQQLTADLVQHARRMTRAGNVAWRRSHMGNASVPIQLAQCRFHSSRSNTSVLSGGFRSGWGPIGLRLDYSSSSFTKQSCSKMALYHTATDGGPPTSANHCRTPSIRCARPGNVTKGRFPLIPGM